MSDEQEVVSQEAPQEAPQGIQTTPDAEVVSEAAVPQSNEYVAPVEEPAMPPPPPPDVPQGPIKLLMVDDDSNFREIFSAKFTANGFEMKTASSGKAAVALLVKGDYIPDLILMDINMPGESGTEVAMAIKQDPKTEHMRIAFLTNLKEPWPAFSGSRDKIAQELGMEDFLEKTDDLDNLVKKVAEIVARPPKTA